ncbi:hypothetical protein V6767_05925 [Martelella sp. FLE1502]
MQNLGQLTDWGHWKKGQHLLVPRSASGRVTLRVNAPKAVGLYYWLVKPDGSYGGEGYFLARVEGLDEIRLHAPFAMAIAPDGEAFIETNAGVRIEPPKASESFTRIVERRVVSPEVAEVMQRANANQRAMMRQMQQILQTQNRSHDAAMRALKKAEEKPREQPKKDDSRKGDSGDAGEAGKQKPASDGGAPAEKAAKGGEGDGSGNQPKG